MGLLTREDGLVARSPEEAEQLQMAGYVKCLTQKNSIAGGRWRNQPCPFYISPEGQAHITSQMGGYYTCPVCQQSHDLLHELPWHGVAGPEAEENMYRDQATAEPFAAGGATRIGLSMGEQGEIGEDLVYQLGNLGEYGPITWWHGGGATGASPLDGATPEWGVEVKTLAYDATHHRFITANERPHADGTRFYERAEKMQDAQLRGKKGVLGVLVMLDYRRSVADIFVKEFPLREGWDFKDFKGTGISNFRSHQGFHLFKEVPFNNPLMDPDHPAPHGSSAFQQGPVEEAPF
jgi:hypothetical protein